MVLAGLAAEGRTTIANVIYIDRGYEDICSKLASLGADISQEDQDKHDCPIEDARDPIEWGTVPYAVEAS